MDCVGYRVGLGQPEGRSSPHCCRHGAAPHCCPTALHGTVGEWLQWSGTDTSFLCGEVGGFSGCGGGIWPGCSALLYREADGKQMRYGPDKLLLHFFGFILKQCYQPVGIWAWSIAGSNLISMKSIH